MNFKSEKMQNNPSISFCICVHNEHEELARLLPRLMEHLGKNDQILIQGDEGKVTSQVMEVIYKFCYHDQLRYIEFPLNNDFAAFKNNLIENAKGDYIFLIDADEIVHPNLLENLQEILKMNEEFDLFILPRVNVVQGLTEEYANSQGWVTQMIPIPDYDKKSKEILKMYGIDPVYSGLHIQVVNPFDYQQRIFKNKPEFRFNGKVHERLPKIEMQTLLPVTTEEKTQFDFSWSLFHVKQFERQKTQNEFYSKIN